jgi:hypothetical protein
LIQLPGLQKGNFKQELKSETIAVQGKALNNKYFAAKAM